MKTLSLAMSIEEVKSNDKNKSKDDNKSNGQE